jgi:hypothetical protein
MARPTPPTDVVRRARAPLRADLRILLLGVWGFLRQCLKSWASPAKESDELESGQ